jgi:spore photoproduct lyase
MKKDYSQKFIHFKAYQLFNKLSRTEQEFVQSICFRHRFTFQEFRQIVEACRDLSMWQELTLQDWWQENITAGLSKERVMQKIRDYLEHLRQSEKNYTESGFKAKRESKKIDVKSNATKIHGMCPVASEKTVCCQLRTIDAVQNCVFGCSYCSIQTFYTDNIILEKDIESKLAEIEIDPNRFYHFGTGQASDSLAWGNREGIIEAHCRFAAQHPNILLEFKTKSNNIGYFLDNNIPTNVVCSWSLNTQKVIDHEEHFTAPLNQRLDAARMLADHDIKVSFHFHPLVFYSGWLTDYKDVVQKILNQFDPSEILFISFGSVTLIKPVIQKIRDLGNPSKILQMQFVSDPHGKFSYPDERKVRMFKALYGMFSEWHKEVFFYLCMEKSSIWEASFGYVYETNDIFEKEFAEKTLPKCISRTKRTAPAKPA